MPSSEATPIVVNDVMYLPVGDSVVALEPETGREIWRCKVPNGLPCVRAGQVLPGGEGGIRTVKQYIECASCRFFVAASAAFATAAGVDCPPLPTIAHGSLAPARANRRDRLDPESTSYACALVCAFALTETSMTKNSLSSPPE